MKKWTWKSIVSGMLCTLSALAMTAIVACDKEEENVYNFPEQGEHIGLMLDGGGIKGINMYCVTNEIPKDDYAVKTLTDYSSLNLNVELRYAGGNVYRPEFTEKQIQEWQDRVKMEHEYYKEKTLFIQQEYHDRDTLGLGWPTFFTAFVNGEVSITCDKTLFGLETGENLGKYFSITVPTDCLPVGIESPYLRYGIGDEMPETVADFFQMKSWILNKYWIKLASIPEEQYDELTFKITFPMTVEHTCLYIASKYKGTNEELKREDKVFEAECLVKFNWK